MMKFQLGQRVRLTRDLLDVDKPLNKGDEGIVEEMTIIESIFPHQEKLVTGFKSARYGWLSLLASVDGETHPILDFCEAGEA